MGNAYFAIRLGGGVSLPASLLEELAVAVERALVDTRRWDTVTRTSSDQLQPSEIAFVVVHIGQATSMFQGACYSVQAIVHEPGGDEATEGVLMPAEILVAGIGHEIEQLAPAQRAAREKRVNDPAYRAQLALTAAMNADRAFLLRYGEDEARRGAANGDLNMLATGIELCAIGGEPMRTAPILLDVLASGRLSPEDARSLRVTMGGLRAWNALGHARLIGNLAWLFRETARATSLDVAVRKALPIRRVDHVWSRLRHLGMPDIDPPQAAHPHEQLVRGPWRKLQERFGTNIAKLCVLVRSAAVTQFTGSPMEDPKDFAIGLRIELETLVGKTLGPMNVPPPAELLAAVQRRPEVLDSAILDDTAMTISALFGKGDFASGVTHAAQALFAQPDNAELMEMMAVGLTQTQQRGRAFKVLVPMMKTQPGPGWTDCLALIGGLLVDDGQTDGAFEPCDAALAFDPFHPRARMFRALAKKKMGNAAGAAEDAAIVRLVHAEDRGVEAFLRNAGL